MLPGLYLPPRQICCCMQASFKVRSDLDRNAAAPQIMMTDAGKVLRLTL